MQVSHDESSDGFKNLYSLHQKWLLSIMITMETVVAIAIGILATIFCASVVGLLIVCKHKCKRQRDLLSQHHRDNRPDLQLIDEEPRSSRAELELDEVEVANPKLDQMLKDERWVDDATGLVPHCISILKTCHHLTERLVGMTMTNADKIRTEEMLTDIVTIAKRINPRVDEVVQTMYAPLDPRLLEARCTALVLSVSHLVLVTKHACKLSGNLDWIDQSLADVEDHLKVLQEASFSLSPDDKTPPNTVTSGDTQQPIINQISSPSESSQV